MRSRIIDPYRIKGTNINKLGVKAILDIMNWYGFGYEVDLYDVTKYLEKRYTGVQRVRYEVDTTFQVLDVLKYIKDNDLLKKVGDE